MATAEKVRVAVRVRPLNRREIDLGTKCVVEMQDNQTVIHHPSEHSRGKQPKSFAYDHCFWSCNETDAHYVSQSEVFDCLGYELLDNAFDGYNACILAYGQTGSGKSYTMMGSGTEQAGIIPRFCQNLFERIKKSSMDEDDKKLFKVEVSYMEIYNERVRDLLDPKGNKHNLRVREHALLGPYVDGLSVLAVSSLEQMQELMEEGNKSRTVAATNMNESSSRSHAVFCIRISQTLIDEASGATGERASKVSLVDLAGSERAEKSGAMGERLREGGSINKSLTTLGLVISALADQSQANAAAAALMNSSMSGSMMASGGGKAKKKFVPYRDSVLTWLLKDSLGGNSKTVMVATISPAADNYEESLSTLRYADRAKRIVNHAIINEDPNAKIIRELRMEVEQLKSQLIERQTAGEPDLRDRLVESEKLVAEMSRSWEERLKETERVHQERQEFLEKMGISVQQTGIKVEKEKFYLVNLNADPAMNELLVYYLKERTLVGSPAAPTPTEVDVVLAGLGIAPLHAWLCVENDPPPQSLHIEPLEGARTLVNGSLICSKTTLRHGDRLLMGNNHFFRVNCPTTTGSSHALSSIANNNNFVGGGRNQQQQQQHFNEFDYGFAQEEVTNKEMTNDPVAATITVLEKQHQLDKEAALDKQRRMYEQQIIALKSQCVSPMTPSYDFTAAFAGAAGIRGGIWPPGAGSTPSTPSTFPLSHVQSGYVQWARERDSQFKKSLARLKEDIVRANSMAREANLIAVDMSKQTVYSVTLQIPASNLTPKRIRTGAFISEPAILVRRKGKGSQLWSMDKLENKLIDMRDVYADWKGEVGSTSPSPSSSSIKSLTPSSPAPPPSMMPPASIVDPFYESQETHSLIGVANVFLEVLFHDVKLDYHVPIISQQGEVSGRLHVEIYRIKTQGESEEKSNIAIGNGNKDDSTSDTCSTASSSSSLSLIGSFFGKTITCRVRIKSANGLPPSLSHFVFCQYNFWSNFESTVVPPVFDPNEAKSNTVHKPESLVFRFDHQKDFEITVSEEFLEYVQEDALSIQVWGHKSTGFTPSNFQQRMYNNHHTQPVFSTNANGEPVALFNYPSAVALAAAGAGGSVNSLSITSNGGGVGGVGGVGGAVDAAVVGVRTLLDRWSEVSRRLRVWVEIHELNDQGKYAAVPVTKANDVGTSGVYHLRQGQQRRIVVDVTTTDEQQQQQQQQHQDADGQETIGPYGSLPVVCQRVLAVSIGCICVRNKNMQKSLDSYQDLDLETLRQRWMEALAHRRTYLDNQIQRLINKPDKSEVDVEREQSLIAQWVTLTEERNAVHVPAPDSNLPGAPTEELVPPNGVERHIPVIFLDLKDEDTAASASSNSIAGGTAASGGGGANNGASVGATTAPLIIGAQSILPKEQSGKMYTLPMFRPDAGEVQDTRAVASWDSSIHEHPALNKTTPTHERVYAILKVVVRLSHPAEIDLHLRKRLCFTVVKPPSFAERWFKRIVGTEALTGTGVFYDVVSHIPKSSFDPEARETLALIAARSDSVDTADGESYIERYTRGISEVESILALDRLRQELVIRELLNAGMKTGLKRATSVPLSERISMMGLPTSRSDSINLAEQARGGGPGQLVVGLNSPNVMMGGMPAQTTSCLPSVQEEQSIEQHHSNGNQTMTVHGQETLPGCPPSSSSEEATSAHSSGYGSQLCLGGGQRGGNGTIRAFDEQEELSSTTEEETGESEMAISTSTTTIGNNNKAIDHHFPQSPSSIQHGGAAPATRNFSKLPLDNSTSFSEYDAHLLETSVISIGSKSSSFLEETPREEGDEENDDGKLIANLNNNLNCDQS